MGEINLDDFLIIFIGRSLALPRAYRSYFFYFLGFCPTFWVLSYLSYFLGFFLLLSYFSAFFPTFPTFWHFSYFWDLIFRIIPIFSTSPIYFLPNFWYILLLS